jgi:hypothetical protein
MKILGILAAIFHLLLFTYIYLTSMNDLSIEDFTLSSAFQYSDKLGSVTLLILTSIVLLLFLKQEKYLENKMMKYLLTTLIFIWLLFFTEHNGHIFFAFIGLMIIIIIPYIICQSNKNEHLFKVSNMCSFFVVSACIMSVCEYFSECPEYFRFLFACTEIVLVLVYFLFLITLAIL